jgi:hypothetical protein
VLGYTNHPEQKGQPSDKNYTNEPEIDVKIRPQISYTFISKKSENPASSSFAVARHSCTIQINLFLLLKSEAIILGRTEVN